MSLEHNRLAWLVPLHDCDALSQQLEGSRQKFCRSQLQDVTAQVSLYDHEVMPAKLDHDLTTRATRRYRLIRVCDHGEMSEVSGPVTRGDGAEKRCAFRAVAESI